MAARRLQGDAQGTLKVCVYIKRLEDIDTKMLAQLVQASVAEVKKRYPA